MASESCLEQAEMVLASAQEHLERIAQVLEQHGSRNPDTHSDDGQETSERLEEILREDRLLQWLTWNEKLDALAAQCLEASTGGLHERMFVRKCSMIIND